MVAMVVVQLETATIIMEMVQEMVQEMVREMLQRSVVDMRCCSIIKTDPL